MDKISDLITNFDDNVKGWLSFIDSNEYVTAALGLFLIVYASYAAPRLPPNILKLFDYPVVKLIIFFLIVYAAKVNPTIAIIAAVGVMVTIHALNKMQFDEKVMILANRQQESMVSSVDIEPMQDRSELDLQFEESTKGDNYIAEDSIVELNSEKKGGCNNKNDFYPQYQNMDPYPYVARYNNKDVGGFDPNSKYASV